MIKLLEKNSLPKINDELISVRANSLFNTYKNNFPFLLFWEQTDENGSVTALIYSLSGNVSLWATKNADYNELKAFLSSISDKVFCSFSVAKELSLKTDTEIFGLVCTANSQKAEAKDEYTTKDFEKLYEMLKNSESDSIDMPPFGDWYADLRCRYNHNSADLCLSETAAACAGFVTNKAALITGVAVKSNKRQQGHGKKIVEAMLCKLSDKKVFVLSALNNLPFYEKCGFEKYNSYGYFELT